MEHEVLHFARVTYKERDRILLRDFELSIMRGEIFGMLPVNAYGLSAFLRVLKYNPPLYYGQVYYGGKPVNSWRDMHRSTNGITVISDVSSLVEGQSVLTNVFVLRSGFRQYILNNKVLAKQLQMFLDDIGENISPYARAEELEVYERVVIEIIRAVVAGHRLIVLQEVGSFIGENQMEKLNKILRHYRDKGYSFIVISGHFEELKRICRRTALMSNGKILTILEGEEMKVSLYPGEYSEKVVQRLREHPEKEHPEELFELRKLSGNGIRNLSITVYRGEYLVIQPLENRIFDEISGMLFGGKEPEDGGFYLRGKRVKIEGLRSLAFIKEEPDETMLFKEMSYLDNLLFTVDHQVPSVWRKKGVARSVRQELSGFLGEEVFSKRIEELSQKERIELVYARIYLQKPDIVFCILPFKGADLSARMLIWELHELLLKRGMAIVVLTMNMADSLSLADRVVQIDENSSVREFTKKDFASLPKNIPWRGIFRENSFSCKENSHEIKSSLDIKL